MDIRAHYVAHRRAKATTKRLLEDQRMILEEVDRQEMVRAADAEAPGEAEQEERDAWYKGTCDKCIAAARSFLPATDDHASFARRVQRCSPEPSSTASSCGSTAWVAATAFRRPC